MLVDSRNFLLFLWRVNLVNKSKNNRLFKIISPPCKARCTKLFLCLFPLWRMTYQFFLFTFCTMHCVSMQGFVLLKSSFTSRTSVWLQSCNVKSKDNLNVCGQFYNSRTVCMNQSNQQNLRNTISDTYVCIHVLSEVLQPCKLLVANFTTVRTTDSVHRDVVTIQIAWKKQQFSVLSRAQNTCSCS